MDQRDCDGRFNGGIEVIDLRNDNVQEFDTRSDEILLLSWKKSVQIKNT